MATTVIHKNIHICVKCKLNCAEEDNTLCCSKCFNWFHSICEGINKNNCNQNFICSICKSKTSCHACSRRYFPRSYRVNCVNCENTYCSKCLNDLKDINIKYFLTPENDFFCKNCDENFLCMKCDLPCENSDGSAPSIFCDLCKKWLHFKCSRLGLRQFNKLGMINDPYFCSSCINNSLPFSNNSKNSFFDKTASKSARVPICQLCIECNSECDNCTACPDLHRVCDECNKCSLIDLDTFTTIVQSKDNDELLLIHINARSLVKNIDKIREFLYTLEILPDVICISESKLSTFVDLSLIQLENYSIVHNDSETSFGGTAIYISTNLSFKVRKDLDINIPGECEASFVELHTSDSSFKRSVVLGSIYRHPHNNFNDFYEQFFETISNIDPNTPIILAGDMNINVSSASLQSLQYKNNIISCGLRNLINNQFTRVAAISETTIDHILTNLQSEILETGVIQWEVADHLPIFIKAKLLNNNLRQKNEIPISYKRFFNSTKKKLVL